MLLHGYWRSTASYRVRIALNLKGIPFRQQTHDLRVGEHRQQSYRALNPQGLVPALEADGETFIQSAAILEWLEDRYEGVRLLPAQAGERAAVRGMAALIGCDIHPLNNLRVLTSLRKDLGASDEQVSAWIARWVTEGFEALETLIARYGKGYAFGAAPTLVDCYLVPQVYSAERFSVDLSTFPHIVAAADKARALKAFLDAHPDAQPDAVLSP